MRISDWSSDVCSSDLEPTAGYCRCRAVPGVRCVQLHNWADFVGGWRHCPPHALCGRRTRDDGCGHRELTNAGRGQALLKLVPPSFPCRFDGHREQRLRSEEHTSELQSLMRNSYAVFCSEKKTR